MKAPIKDWLDFGVRAAIVVAAVYLAMVFFFMADFRRLSNVTSSLETQIARIDKQTQFLTTLTMSNNTDALYHMGLEQEAKGDVVSAIKNYSMALQLAQYNAQQYKIKLEQIMSQSHK